MSSIIFAGIYLLLVLRLSWIDWHTGLLPDKFTCPLLWCGLLYQLICNPLFLSAAVWGAIAGYLFLFILYWGYRAIFGREGIGYGDIKFLSALGAWHGWQALAGLLFLASAGGCIVSLLATRRGLKIKHPLPFGPFLAAAGIISVGLNYDPSIRALFMPLL